MRTDLAAVGATLVVAGTGLSLSPSLGGGLSSAVTPTVLAVLGGVVALAGVLGLSLDAEKSGEESETAESPPGDLLGAEFDETLARIERMSSTELRRSGASEDVRQRLREAAIAATARREGIDREAAASRVDSGEWTDDPVAAAFLGSPRAPASVRWREALSATPRPVSRAGHTARVLEGMV
jgi:hypothetical protein